MNISQNDPIDSQTRSLAAPGVLATAALLVCGLFSAVSQAKEALAEASEDISRPMDEIVVTAERAIEPVGNFEALLENSLKARLDEKIAQIKQLNEESATRQDEDESAAEQPGLRLGYDPHGDEQDGLPGTMTDLPLDLIEPATIISVDY